MGVRQGGDHQLLEGSCRTHRHILKYKSHVDTCNIRQFTMDLHTKCTVSSLKAAVGEQLRSQQVVDRRLFTQVFVQSLVHSVLGVGRKQDGTRPSLPLRGRH